MAELVRKEAELFIKEILTEYARKIRSVNKNAFAAEVLPLFNPRMDAFYKLVTSEDMDNHIFSRLNEKGIEELSGLCQSLAELYELRTTITNSQVQDAGKFYSFHDGVFYIDARNTGVTISQIFKDVFKGTTWEQDRDFYIEICRNCLGIDNPNRISGEYKVNLKFDGNDETTEDNEFGRIMRQKYISDRFAESGADGVASGRIELKQFDYKYGTDICKSENDNYAIQDKVYHELIPANNLIKDLINLLGANILRILLMLSTKDIISAMLMLSLIHGLINPYIDGLKKKISKVDVPELKKCGENWIKYFEKFHFEDIDRFELNQGETIGFIRAVSVLVSHLPDDTNIITYNGCVGLSNQPLEEAAYIFYELGFTGGCANLKNKLFDWIYGEKDSIKDSATDARNVLQNNLIVSSVMAWIPEETKNNLTETFSIENIAKVIDDTAQKISESKTDLEKFEKTYIHKLLGFTYTNQTDDYYFTEEGSLQSKMGFMDYYDDCGKYIGMDGLKDIVVTFPYEDKEYRVEFWYGPYGDGRSLGAEIGIYYRSLSDALEREYRYKDTDSQFILYDCVKDKDGKIRELENQGKEYDESEIKSDQFVMTMDVYYDNRRQYSHTTKQHTGKKDDNDHFWCLAIRSSELGKGEDKNINRKKMRIEGKIFKDKDPKLISIMRKALSETTISGTKIIVKPIGETGIFVEFGGIYETN